MKAILGNAFIAIKEYQMKVAPGDRGKVFLEQDFALRIKPSSSLGSEITRKTTSFIFIVFSEYYHR